MDTETKAKACSAQFSEDGVPTLCDLPAEHDGAHATAVLMPPKPPRRIARVVVSPRELHALLGLPANVRVVHVVGTCDPIGIHLILEGDRFERVPEDVEAPILAAFWRREFVMVDDKPYWRLALDGWD